MACQAILNDGDMIKPHMIRSLTAANGTANKDYEESDEPEILQEVTSPETAQRVVAAMEGAAEHYGFDYIGPDGWVVAAKTGTAQTGTSTNAWIVSGAIDADNGNTPKYVVVVMAADQTHDGIYYKDSVDQIYDALVDYDAGKSSGDVSD